MNSKFIVNITTNVNGLNTPIVHHVSDRAYRQNMKHSYDLVLRRKSTH